MTRDLAAADARDPDLPGARPLAGARRRRELRPGAVSLPSRRRQPGASPSPRLNALQAKVLATFGVDTRPWDTARIT